jgi:hypothetical protein
MRDWSLPVGVHLLIDASRQILRESPDFQTSLERNRNRGGRWGSQGVEA